MRKRTFFSLPMIAILVVATFFVGIVGFRFYSTYVMEGYLGRVDGIIADANPHIQQLNTDAAQFQGDPAGAKKVKVSFDQAESAARDAERSLRETGTPTQAFSYHKDLISLYNATSTFAGDLSDMATYIIERGILMSDLSLAVDKFTASAQGAQTDVEVINAARELTETIRSTESALGRVKKPKIQIYSNDAIEQSLDDLALMTDTLAAAIEAGDVTATRAAAENIKTVLQRDWAKTLQTADPTGVARYQTEQGRLLRLQKKVISERQAL